MQPGTGWYTKDGKTKKSQDLRERRFLPVTPKLQNSRLMKSRQTNPFTIGNKTNRRALGTSLCNQKQFHAVTHAISNHFNKYQFIRAIRSEKDENGFKKLRKSCMQILLDDTMENLCFMITLPQTTQ